MTKLNSIPTLVESPFIIAEIGGFTFGSYSGGHNYTFGPQKVTYPNYMESLTIIKMSNKVNTYTLTFNYQITANDDPNLLDRVFSTQASKREITLSYGDWNAPSYIYKKEKCMMTNVRSTVDVKSSKITYVVSCISTSAVLAGTKQDFPQRVAKPSDIIKELINNSSYRLTEVFSGMSKAKNPNVFNLIASDDRVVTIDARAQTNVLDYIGYLVECMLPQEYIPGQLLQTLAGSAQYSLVVSDDLDNKYGGSYFRVVKTIGGRNATSVNTSIDTYEIDVGYPGDNFVTNFSTTSDEQWTILYDEATQIQQEQYIYRLDNNGNMTTTYSPAITRNSNLKQTTAAEESWWNKVTAFPITATLTFKGLARPSILMSRVRLNVLFFGREHITSGLYVITKQEDTINSSGYSTTLTLLRTSA